MSFVKFLITFVLILKCLSVFSSSSPLSIQDPVVFDNIMRHLRDNWQSPITYLKKRGYIPKTEETLLLANSNNVKNQPARNAKITEEQNKQPVVAIYDEITPDILQQSIDKTAKLSRAYQRAKDVTDAQLASLSPGQRNRLLIKKANLSLSPHALSPIPVATPLVVPASNKLQTSVLNVGPSGPNIVQPPGPNTLQPPGAINNGLEAEHNVSFLHSMKEKFLGLFRNKQNDNKKDKFGNFDFSTKGQHNLNENESENESEELERNKLIDKEFQLILDKSLENHKRCHDNNELLLKMKSNKQPQHSKLKARADDNDNVESI